MQALRGVDLEVEAGRITGLIGPNGAGKTTLFNCITGVVPPDRGRILLEGRDIAGLRPDQITARGLVRTFQIARGLPGSPCSTTCCSTARTSRASACCRRCWARRRRGGARRS